MNPATPRPRRRVLPAPLRPRNVLGGLSFLAFAALAFLHARSYWVWDQFLYAVDPPAGATCEIRRRGAAGADASLQTLQHLPLFNPAFETIAAGPNRWYRGLDVVRGRVVYQSTDTPWRPSPFS